MIDDGDDVTQRRVTNFASRDVLPWLVAAGLLLALLTLAALGYWRASGVGPQVQVPMFYDAHYLYPRAWTQEQAAPGVPPPAPLAFWGENRVSQQFVAGSDNLAMLEVWLAGAEDTAVTLTLSDDQDRVYAGRIPLTNGPAGGIYRVSLPPIAAAGGHTFRLTLAAPDASESQPVTTRTVGGDRLGGALRINEYARPGNLALVTYARGVPGGWWLDAIGEQILPDVFRLRVQQYKPEPFKGEVFAALLVATAVLTFIFLVLATPGARPTLRGLGWGVTALLAAFLLWQAGSGRVSFAADGELAQADAPPALAPAPQTPARVIDDLAATLWTVRREPEARFVTTEVLAALPAIRVPAASRLSYPLVLAPNGRLRVGVAARGEGALQASVRVGDAELALREVTAVPSPSPSDAEWLELDLAPFAGNATAVELITRPLAGAPEGLWLMPQLSAETDWLLPDPLPADVEAAPAGQRFDDTVELVGYALDPSMPAPGAPLTVTLYWRALRTTPRYATVFVHLLSAQGEIVAQQDAQPVGNSYPLPLWQTDAIVADAHTLRVPPTAAVEGLTLAVGLYDPETLVRWTAVAPDGTPLPDGRAVLPLPGEDAP